MENKQLVATVFGDIQSQIDHMGYLGQDYGIQSGTPEEWTAPVPAKSEYEWYGSFLFLSQDRLQRYGDAEDMDDHAFTSGIYDIYAEEAAAVKNAEGNILTVKSDNVKVRHSLEELLFERLNINHSGFEIARGMAKFGDEFRFMVLDKERKGVLYLKDMPAYSVYRLELDNKLIAFVQYGPSGEAAAMDPFSVVHWRLGMTKDRYKPYGVGLLDPARRHFRQLKLMEDGMVVYRLARAPERRMFFINVGRMPPAKAQGYIEQIISKFRKQPAIRQNGVLDWRSHNLAVDEDFYIPVRDGNDGTRIEQLPGAQNLSEIDDVVWFKDQIVAFAKIPRVYLQDREGGAAERRENLQIQDVRFAKTIGRFQAFFLQGLAKVCIVHLLLQGFTKREALAFTLEGNKSSFETEKLMLEIQESKLSMVRSLIDSGFPRSYAMQHVLNMSAPEYDRLVEWRRNEDLIMAQREAEVEALRTASASTLEQKLAQWFEDHAEADPTTSFLRKIAKTQKIEDPIDKLKQSIEGEEDAAAEQDGKKPKGKDDKDAQEGETSGVFKTVVDPKTGKPVEIPGTIKAGEHEVKNPNIPRDALKPRRDQINPRKPRTWEKPSEPYSSRGRGADQSLFGSITGAMPTTAAINEIASDELRTFLNENEANDRSVVPTFKGAYRPTFDCFFEGDLMPLNIDDCKLQKKSVNGNGGWAINESKKDMRYEAVDSNNSAIDRFRKQQNSLIDEVKKAHLEEQKNEEMRQVKKNEPPKVMS